MGRETCLPLATGAHLSITRTIGTSPAHLAIVCFHFVSSDKLRSFDTDDRFFGGRSEDHAFTTDLVPPLSCAT